MPDRRPAVTVDEAKATSKIRLERRFFDKYNVSGFSHMDPEIAFFTQVAALVRPNDVVLDFGAGRGEFLDEDPSHYRAWLQNLRGRTAHADGCDVDKAVHLNRTLDTTMVIAPGQPLPYEDNRFNLSSRAISSSITTNRSGPLANF